MVDYFNVKLLKPFSGEKILSPVEMGPKNGVFRGKMGIETLDFGFDPHFSKRPPLSRTQKNVAESLCAEGREITHAQNRNL